MKYLLKCIVCDATFPSFEKYGDHIVINHPDRLELRMKPQIVKAD